MHLSAFKLFVWSSYILIAQELRLKITRDVPREESTLVLLHVLFRHGNRTVNGPEELYPKDPYLNATYFPYGLSQLTNAGKLKAYHVGKALRKRYNKFLGPYYYPQIVESWSTNFSRTKASLELVLAGLFPPYAETVWNPMLNWQPIPYNYHPTSQDRVLSGIKCPYYLNLYDNYIQSVRYQTELKQYGLIFEYISKSTGLKVEKFLNVYDLFFGLRIEEEWGFLLPEWTKNVWPHTIIDLAIREYFVATASTDLSRMASGYFLEKIITDTFNKIDSNDSGRKIYLYSAHEGNIAKLLLLLKIFEPLHIPNYSAYVIFEIHRIGGKYGIKIYYENYTSDKPQLLKLPACETFCEIGKFFSLIEEYMPSEDLCNKEI